MTTPQLLSKLALSNRLAHFLTRFHQEYSLVFLSKHVYIQLTLTFHLLYTLFQRNGDSMFKHFLYFDCSMSLMVIALIYWCCTCLANRFEHLQRMIQRKLDRHGLMVHFRQMETLDALESRYPPRGKSVEVGLIQWHRQVQAARRHSYRLAQRDKYSKRTTTRMKLLKLSIFNVYTICLNTFFGEMLFVVNFSIILYQTENM